MDRLETSSISLLFFFSSQQYRPDQLDVALKDFQGSLQVEKEIEFEERTEGTASRQTGRR